MELTQLEVNLKHWTEEEIDHVALHMFTDAMRKKLNFARDVKFRGGWWDETKCDIQYLSELLLEAVKKGDPVDIANFAMMLHQRDSKVFVKSEPTPNPLSSFYVLEKPVALQIAKIMLGFIFPDKNGDCANIILMEGSQAWQHIELRIAEFLSGTEYGNILPDVMEEDGWREHGIRDKVPEDGTMVDLMVRNAGDMAVYQINRAWVVNGEWWREFDRSSHKRMKPIGHEFQIVYWRFVK